MIPMTREELMSKLETVIALRAKAKNISQMKVLRQIEKEISLSWSIILVSSDYNFKAGCRHSGMPINCRRR